MSTLDKIHYCSIYGMIVTGFYVASYGPLIPFYSKMTNQDQTYFSFIFLVRSIANILGGFLIKYLFKIFKIKPLIVILCSSLSLSLFICSLSPSNINLIVTLFIASCSLVMLSIVVISFNFIVFQAEKAYKNIQILGFVFGVGAMLGPFFIIFLQLATYKFLALASVLLIPLYLQFDLPEIYSVEGQVRQTNVISKKSELLICILMVIYATQQLGMGSWIPTYAIKAGISDKEHSGIYSMMFWVPNCIFRLVWIYIPLNFHAKLKIIVYSLAFVGILTFLLQSFQLYKAVCIVGPIAAGILLSNLYAIFLALPTQCGYSFTGQNSANLAMANSIGEGLLITPIGYSISIFGFQSLIAIEGLLAVIMCCVYNQTMQSLEQKNQQSTSIKLMSNQY